jgi:two-component system sensor histidine kinase BarA
MTNDNILSSNKSFRRQLTVIFTFGILVLAIAGALGAAWIAKINIEGQLFEDGLQVTESLAKQTVLALIYDSAENAEDAATAAMGFPAIKQVAIITVKGDILLTKGTPLTHVPDLSSVNNGVTLLEKNINNWLFAAPVFLTKQTASDQLLPEQTSMSRELIGYVLVNKSKEKIGDIFTAAIINNLGISLLFAALLLVFIHLNFNRLVTPLDKLATVMGLAEQGDSHAYASLDGPKEVVDIARAFNKMIEALAEHRTRLKNHNEILEYEVSQRTRDLVYARDMAIEANRNKSYFLSNVSHELRTPLQSILGYSDLVLETLPVEMDDIRHDINTIVHNAESLLHMINSVLDMSKIEAGRVEVNAREIDLQELIDNVIETAKPLIKSNQNEFRRTVQLCKSMINVDGDKLRQVLINLLGNAAKFTERGLVELDVEQDEESLRIRVSDNGIGMSQELVDHIFEPFFQIDASHTRRFQGTGLGLAISYQFCQLMGGSIKVKSQLNQGSSFIVEIPYN